jgi:hypothetical protein
VKTYSRSFAAGEIAPLLYGRIDLAKFQTGLAQCLNFIVTPQGPVENRAGFEWVLQARDLDAALIPFTYNAEQSFVLEMGDGYLRFHTQGGTLLNTAQNITAITQASPGRVTYTGTDPVEGKWVYLAGIGGMTTLNGRYAVATNVNAGANTFELYDLFGDPIDTSSMAAYTSGGTMSRVYEIVTPYDPAHLFELHFVQSADVLTITHPSYATRELRRLGATNWTLTEIDFAPQIGTPAAPAVTANLATGGDAVDQEYVTTAVAQSTLEESLASASVTVQNDLTVDGNYNTIQPSVVTGAVRYNVYKRKSGIYGYLGQTDGTLFRDENIEPDTSKTPPLLNQPFAEGAIVSVEVTNGGSNYNTAAATGGAIDSVNMTAGGIDYVTPTATATGFGGTGSGATFTVTQVGGTCVSIVVNTPGSGYVEPVIIAIADAGPGTGAAAAATATNTVSPQVELTVTDPDGSGAELAAIVVDEEITGVRVINGGSGYTAPVVSVSAAAGGSGATFGTPVLTGGDVHPTAVSYYEQRRCFGGTTGNPQTIWTTRSGTESNLTRSIPTQDDDAITARIVAREANIVRHLVPLNDLLALTSGGVWRVASSDGGALTPSTFSVKPQSYVGASMVQPVVTSQSILYAPARGSHLRELAYQWETQTYRANDVSVMAPHLVDFKTITQLSYSSTPHQALWAVRSDGILLGMTYQPEHEVKAWHHHATNGTFRSVCCVPEGDEDGIYVIVRRTINGTQVDYIERMHSRQIETLADAFFVDAGATYEGAATDTISGLWHLEGEEVVVLADGGVSSPQTVTNGAITLDGDATTVHVGLAYECDLETLPLSAQVEAFAQGMNKNVSQIWLRVLQSSVVKAGPAFDKLSEHPQRNVSDDLGDAPALIDGVITMKTTPSWGEDGTVCVRQDLPLPLTVLSLTLGVATGG